MSRIHTHPGEALREDVVPALGLERYRRCRTAWRDSRSPVARAEWPRRHFPCDGPEARRLAWRGEWRTS